MDLTDSTTQSVLLAAASGALPSTQAGASLRVPGPASGGWLLGRHLLEPGPQGGTEPLPLVLQQLLVKGLQTPSAELLTVQVGVLILVSHDEFVMPHERPE